MLSASGREVSIKNCYKEFGKLSLSWIFPQIFGIKIDELFTHGEF